MSKKEIENYEQETESIPPPLEPIYDLTTSDKTRLVAGKSCWANRMWRKFLDHINNGRVVLTTTSPPIICLMSSIKLNPDKLRHENAIRIYRIYRVKARGGTP
jgi:hypothetical protein